MCDERITECAKTAQIYDVISKLENGFDTMLGEGGAGLSEGQIQRLAVARALHNDFWTRQPARWIKIRN